MASAQSLTFLVLLLPFLAAAVAPLLVQRLKHNAAWLLALVPLFNLVHFAGFLPEVAAGGAVTGGYAWVPDFNVNFSWYQTGTSGLFR